MKARRLVIVVSLGLVVGLAFAPITTLAGAGPGGHGGGMASGSRPAAPLHGGSPGAPQGAFQASPLRFHHSFRPFPCCGGGTVWVPPGYYGGPVYYPPPSYYAYYDPTYASPPTYPAPAVYGSISLAPAREAIPDVIEYPNGRYELRGDGLTTPYTWVWIPKPPPAPAAPPAAPPSPPEPPSSRDSSPSRPARAYRWTDEQGGVHWTDRLEAIPARYRQQATQTLPI